MLVKFSSFVILLAVLACSGNEDVFQPQSFDELPGHTMAIVEGTVQTDFYDIMKVTGHRNVATLEKYIRADKLEVAQSLAARYDYFK